MIIKRFENSNLDDVFSVFEECGHQLFTNPQIITKENIVQSLLTQDDGFSLLFCIYNGDFKGFITLNRINYTKNSAFIGNIAIKQGNDQFLGIQASKWIIDYAFDTLNLNRVYGHTWSDNPKMDVFYKRLGAVHEGTEREHSWKQGKYVDLKIWGILRKEYGNSSTDTRS